MADITKIQPIGSSTQYELGARYLTTARTLTIGDTGKTFNGTANVSWSKAEILGSSDSHHFLRGDGTWSNTLESPNGSTLIQLVNNYNNRTDRNLWLVSSNSMGLAHTPARDSNSGIKWIIRLNSDQTAIMADYPYQGIFMNQQLTSSTVNSLSGSWFGSGSGDPWPNTDWCVLQCGDTVDKWQLTTNDGVHLSFRQNDSGGTNTSWGAWHTYVDRAGDTMSGNLSSAGYFISSAQIATTWINGTHNGVFRCNTHPGGNGSFFPWFTGKTKNGGWGIGCLTGTSGETLYFIYGSDSNYNSQNNTAVTNVRITNTGQLYGAVWNDYAEFRKENSEEKEQQTPGRCVRELGNGALALTTKRLERGCEIVSDTYGFAIGENKDNGYTVPIASTGRVLAYPYESIKEFAAHIGWPVCSGPNGTVSIMTEEEEEKYPSRIIGTVSEIPDYETWGSGNVLVNNRIWIRVR